MELDIEAGQQLFEKLQPVCSRLAKDQSRDNVRSLCLALDGAPDPALQALQEYVLFPLRVILKQPKSLSDEVYTDVCGCIGKVLARTTVNRWEMCRDLFSSLSILLTSPVNFGTVSDVSEEMKSSVIKCLELLVNSTESRAIEPLYRLESLPMLGHLVSMLLDVAQRDRARHVRLHALHCLLALMQSHNKVEKSAARSLGDTFAAFLPGMSMGLCKIITADEKQGQMITVLAVEAWRRVVTLTMGDKSVFPNETKRKKETKTEEDRLAQLRVERNSDWVKSTSANLLILLKDIAGIRTHSSWKVRASLVDWASKLLTECHRSLEEAVPVLLEVLVGLISDDYDGVASKARKAVESFSQSHMHGESERTLVEILEDNLYSLATSLPRQMRTADDTQKLSIFNLLTGYLQLLGPHTCSLVRSMSHLKRLSTALVQVLEFDCTDIKITEDVSFITGHGASALLPSHTSMLQRPQKYFRHFSDDRILDKLIHTCHLLGYYGDIEILVDHFLDVFHETKVYRMPVTLILNEMMVGTVTVDDSAKFHSDVGSKEQEQLKALVRMLVEEYLMPANFNLKTSNVDETEGLLSPLNKLSYSQLTLTPDSQPIASLNANVLQLCLFIEGFGKFSQVLGTEFAPLLMMVLYPLMEKLGDEKAFISTTAYLSLTQISSHCHYSSVDKLLQANSDYLVNAVSLKLRHLRHNPRAPLVLKVTLQYSSAELLPLVHDTIQEVLSTLDQYYGENAVMFMNVLHALVLAVEKWYPPSKHENDRLFATEKPVRCSEDVVEFMKNHHSARLVSEGDVEEEDAVEAGEDGGLSEEPQDIPSEPPTHVSTVKEVLVRSKHLLSSGNPRLRLLVLDTISHAASALKDHQDVLLPLVHQLWPPFVERFQDEERLVTLKAFQTLLCLAEVCGDFIRKRTVTGVIPKLLRFLLSQAQTSIKVGPAYTFTAAFKLQLALLSDLGTLAPFLGLEGSDVESVLQSCLPYLSSRQPAPLQQAAVRTLRKISALEPDLVWLLLNQIYCPIDYLPPSQDLPHIEFGDSSKKRTEYTDNVRDLLTTLS